MIKEAIEKIQALVTDGQSYEEREIHGNLHYIDRTGKPIRIFEPAEQSPDRIGFNSLSGLAEYINTDFDLWKETGDKMAVVIDSATKVRLVSRVMDNIGNARWEFATASTVGSDFKFSTPFSPVNWYPLVNFVIALQSQFVDSPDIESTIAMLGNLHNTKIAEHNDNGFSQALQIKTGITTKSKVEVKNPIELRPYRTFREIDQPVGQFILRFQEDKECKIACALFCADGGQWELIAKKKIKEFLEFEIKEQIPIFV